MTNNYANTNGWQLTYANVFSQSKQGLSLGSVYAYGSTGAAIGYRFAAPTSGNLVDVYFFVTAVTGTPGVTTVELRNWNTTTSTKPGTTLHATTTISPGTSANKWIKATFASPYSVTQGAPYWIVIGDAGWTTGKTVSVDYRATPYSILTATTGTGFGTVYTTSNGFTSQTASSYAPAMVLKFADGTLFGNPYTTTATDTNNSRERGLKIASLTEDLIISGIQYQAITNVSGMKIYSGSTAPGGTTDMTATFPTGTGGGSQQGGYYFAPVTLRKNQVYRVVFTYSGNDTAPGYFSIENAAASADIPNCGLGGGTMYHTIDNGSGGWTDSTDKYPIMALVLRDSSVQPGAGALINGGAIGN